MTKNGTANEPGCVRTGWVARRSDDPDETRRVITRSEALLERLRMEFGLEPVIPQRPPQ